LRWKRGVYPWRSGGFVENRAYEAIKRCDRHRPRRRHRQHGADTPNERAIQSEMATFEWQIRC